MTFLTHLSAFFFGFSLACIIILRVSLKPKAKEVLKAVGVIQKHKARVPKIRYEMDEEDEVIG